MTVLLLNIRKNECLFQDWSEINDGEQILHHQTMLPNIPLGILETVFLWIIKVLFECDNLNPTYASFLQILDITYNFFTISTAILFVCSLLWPILVCIHVCGNIPVCKCSMKRFIVPSNNQTSSSSGESCGSVAVGTNINI